MSTVTRCCCHQDGGLGGEVKGLGGKGGGGDPEDDLLHVLDALAEDDDGVPKARAPLRLCVP